ncbi:unnamed protein product [Ilex paraguariensis]|uniref:Bromo domain-containing protein n=1 Tax=Ilex paraguariensis TaxID=185542 RepID=A0ABC8RQV1_9AQUA
MKRKRGNKKGKTKKLSVGTSEGVPDVVYLDTEDNSGVDAFDNVECDSGAEAETPSSLGTDQPQKLVRINSGGLIDKAAVNSVYSRVKVKIKTSKTLDSQLTSSDAPTQSDTDKSSQQAGLEKQVLIEKMEDSANSLPEINMDAPGNLSKKAGSIKIKSRGFSSSSMSLCSNVGLVQGERTLQKESELLHWHPQYSSKQELSASLEVIKKVMKMDAAEPFNAPVNTIALGIPDYFDVIDTPMDFGTICSNLENGGKYTNSADVFKDVQYIWDNCSKYNNKGDYILELLKRVKKNFIKYWTAAGLKSEQPQSTNGVESIQAKDVAPSSHGKKPVKVGHPQHKARKRPGVKRHKDDCLCAICVMMRRRQEREDAQIVEDQLETSEDHPGHEVKREGTSPVESPSGADISSNMENSADRDTDADLEEKGEEVRSEDTDIPLQEKQEEDKENRITFQTKGGSEISEYSQLDDRSKEEHNMLYQTQRVELIGHIRNDTRKEEISLHHEDESAAMERKRAKVSREKIQKAKIYENLRRFEHPLLSRLCGTLFTENPKSVWNGPHSMVRRQRLIRRSSIHEAISTFMK